jgi:sec-independent protein translocase protein TatA
MYGVNVPNSLCFQHFGLLLHYTNIEVMNVQYASIFQPEHLLLVLAIVLLFFGGKKIPELMRGLGEGVREFNAAKSNIKQEIEQGMREKPATPTTTPTTAEPVTEKKA